MLKKAQIKLTVWYTTIIMLVTISFSAFIYFNVLNATQRALDIQQQRIERRFMEFGNMRNMPKPIPNFSTETILEIREKVFIILLFVNITVLVFSSILGYFLAKRTLKPVQLMIDKQKLFISSAAHELKTPLTAIKTNLEVTLRDKDLDLLNAKQSLKTTINQIDNLNIFTNKLLKQSKYQNGLQLKLAKINISKIINNTLDNLEPIYLSKDIKINYKPKNYKVLADEHSITEVFTNIIENAIKYSKENSKINILEYKTKNFVNVKVKDNGIGISKKDLENIFDPFYRAEKSREKNSSLGFGLGLSIAYEIIKKHKGNIKVLSKIDKGTSVIISLPKNNT